MMQLRNENASPAAMALNSLGVPTMPPVDQPALLMSQVLQNPAHMRGKTISLAPGQHAGPMTLRFTFDSLAACVVTVYRSALLAPGQHGTWEVESAAWSSPPAPFPAGLGQTHAIEWETLWHSQAMSATFESEAKHCPLLVELKVEDENGTATSIEWTICQLLTARSGSAGKTRAEVVCQLIRSNSQVLELREVFGSEPAAGDDSTRQDCIVCQSEPRDTAVLPCRHMCLCSRCSDYIRTRTQFHSYKCPICREKIGRMMRVEPDAAEASLSRSDLGSEVVAVAA